MAALLGVTYSTIKTYAFARGERRLSKAMALRAAKICADYSDRFLALSRDFQSHADQLAKKHGTGPWRKGFHEMRVRDESGIPRHARGWGNANAPGYSKEELAKKNLPPF